MFLKSDWYLFVFLLEFLDHVNRGLDVIICIYYSILVGLWIIIFWSSFSLFSDWYSFGVLLEFLDHVNRGLDVGHDLNYLHLLLYLGGALDYNILVFFLFVLWLIFFFQNLYYYYFFSIIIIYIIINIIIYIIVKFFDDCS